MPRYPECVWSGVEELGHIEIIRSCRKHWKLQNMWLVTGKPSRRLVWHIRWYHSMWHVHHPSAIVFYSSSAFLVSAKSLWHKVVLFNVTCSDSQWGLLLCMAVQFSVLFLFFCLYNWIKTNWQWHFGAQQSFICMAQGIDTMVATATFLSCDLRSEVLA